MKIKNTRRKGMRFEAKVRADLEKKGWIVSKWQNNIEFSDCSKGKFCHGKLIPARQGKYRLTSTGFPDFIAFRTREEYNWEDNLHPKILYEIIGVECKSKGYLDKEEKFKCKWLLDNNIFSKILIAKKGKKRGEIIYEEFKWKDM